MKWLAFIVALSCGCRTASPLILAPEARTTLHVGDTAVVQVPSDRRYTEMPGSTGNAIAFMNRDGERFVYRAVKVGPDVIVISPNVPNGDCISCATLHYFISVVP